MKKIIIQIVASRPSLVARGEGVAAGFSLRLVLALVALLFTLHSPLSTVCASDGNATPAVKTVTINKDGVLYVDSTRANFDSGTYNDSTTQWWGDEVRLGDLIGGGASRPKLCKERGV